MGAAVLQGFARLFWWAVSFYKELRFAAMKKAIRILSRIAFEFWKRLRFFRPPQACIFHPFTLPKAKDA